MQINSSLSAIVTGGASGLGLATVKALRAAGAKVAIFDRSDEQGQQAATETGAIYCSCDVMSDESVDAAFAKARAANGQERALVCCAGGGNAIPTARRDKETPGKINIFPSDQFEWVLKLNTVGTFRCITRAAAGMMTLEPIDTERGVCVNTASAAATDGQMGQAAYSAAKAAIVGMTWRAKAFASRRSNREFSPRRRCCGIQSWWKRWAQWCRFRSDSVGRRNMRVSRSR
jgi:NAD(P)-dependent dehydrogenase (short-subunit alcohol dehydrogenase family)